MEDQTAGIVEQYAEHLSKRASSAVVFFTVVGVIAGAALGAAPGRFSHSLISAGANYFAVLLGAVAGGILGRTVGERRALGLRLQAQMALRQLQFESRFVSAPAAPAARPAVPAPAPVAAPAAAPVSPAPVASPAPLLTPAAPATPVTPAPVATPAQPQTQPLVVTAPATPSQPGLTTPAAPTPLLPAAPAPLASPPAFRTEAPVALTLPPLSAKPS